VTVLAAGAAGHDTRLIGAALLAIALIVLLITKFRMHPFLGLILGSGLLGIVAGMPVDKLIDSFSDGVGDTVSGVGVLIALGAILGKLLIDSGGAEQIVDTIVGRASGRRLPWAIALVASLIGLPMFFEVGLVLLIPIVLMVARRTQTNVLLLGIPALAGLSVLHGLVPPHPGPLVAVDALKADLGLTLGLGLLIAIPTVIVAGPLFARLAVRWVPNATAPAALVPAGGGGGLPPESPASASPASASPASDGTGPDSLAKSRQAPSFLATLCTVLLPVVLMLGKAFTDILAAEDSVLRRLFDFIGDPLVALLAAVVLGMFTLGRPAGLNRDQLSETVRTALPPIAGIILIVGAGGGFKSTLVDAGVGDVIAELARSASLSALLLGWLLAVGIRLATGSATVATVTSAGIMAPLAAGLDPVHGALLALAIGAGSLFFSHVNDAGFWLVKEYFGLSVGQTLKSWSVMETLISVVAIVLILALGALL
jgi:GntP family gluconate:H+ symporter